METRLEIGLVVYQVLISLFSLGPLTCIRGYLRNKPFGMQTVFDKALINFTVIVQTGILIFSSSVGIGLVVRYIT